MANDVNEILQHTPYNSYEDLFQAVYSNKATIKLTNGACRDISNIEKPFFSDWGIFLGTIPSAITIIAISLCSHKFGLLLLLFLLLFLPHILYLLNNIKIKTNWIVYALVFIDLFIKELPLTVLVILLCWLMCSWGVTFWSRNMYKTSIRILRDKPNEFVWAFYSNDLHIVDSYGNTYNVNTLTNDTQHNKNDVLSKKNSFSNATPQATSNTNTSEICLSKEDKHSTKHNDYHVSGQDIAYYPQDDTTPEPYNYKAIEYKKLLKLLKATNNIHNVDEAIEKFSHFYIDKGIDIPLNLYVFEQDLPQEDKCEKLLKILELGTGVNGIENVKYEFIDFYASKGYVIPDDVF